VYKETSGFYIFNKDVFIKLNRRIGNKPYIQETSNIENIDIDEPKDFEFAQRIIGDN
jgi:CMP-N-acetylneuraminic acid synthetase